MNKKGFTLIELLVVIAIIGILASIVTASLNTARLKGADAVIKSDLANVRTQANNWYDDNGFVYATTPFDLAQCPSATSTGNIFADEKIFSAVSAAYTLSGGIANSLCVATVDAWAVTVKLKTSDSEAPNPDFWCVDSMGSSRPEYFPFGVGVNYGIRADACY